MRTILITVCVLASSYVNAAVCNKIQINESLSTSGKNDYCFETRQKRNILMNLTTRNIEIMLSDSSTSIIYSGEYLVTTSKFKIMKGDRVNRIITKFDKQTFILRDPKPKRTKRAAAAAALPALAVPVAVGATLGALGVVATADNQSPTSQQVAAGAFGGAVAAAATPALGGLAAGSVGIAAAGACMEACH